MLRKYALAVYKKLKKQLQPYSLNIVLGGSVAKNTSIKNDELDIFIELSQDSFKVDSYNLFKYCEKYEFNYKYVTHPYITIFYEKLKVDIVPYHCEHRIRRSVEHVQYINNLHLNVKEVKNLKKMLKKYGLYGSETTTAGFSGYLCELLISKFASISRIKDNYKNICKLLFSKITDPCDTERDLLAAVSIENRLRFLCMLFKKRLIPRYLIQYKYIHNSEKTSQIIKKYILNIAQYVPIECICTSEYVYILCNELQYRWYVQKNMQPFYLNINFCSTQDFFINNRGFGKYYQETWKYNQIADLSFVKIYSSVKKIQSKLFNL